MYSHYNISDNFFCLVKYETSLELALQLYTDIEYLNGDNQACCETCTKRSNEPTKGLLQSCFLNKLVWVKNLSTFIEHEIFVWVNLNFLVIIN